MKARRDDSSEEYAADAKTGSQAVPAKGRVAPVGKSGRWLAPYLQMAFDYCAVLAGIKITYLVHNLLLRRIFPSFGAFSIPADYLYLIFPFVYVILLRINKYYTKKQPLWDSMETLLKTSAYATLFLIGIMYFAKNAQDISRVFVVVSGGMIFLSLFGSYLVTSRILRFLGIWNVPAIAIGSGSAVNRMLAAMEGEPYLGYRVVGWVDIGRKKVQPNKPLNQIPLLGGIDEMEKIIRLTRIQDVIIAVSVKELVLRQEIIERVHPLVKKLSIMPNLSGLPLSNLEIQTFMTQKAVLLTVRNNLLLSPARECKHFLDIIMGALAFVLAAPLMLLLWLLVRLDSPGPGLFVGTRIGYRGREFNCYKFRSMYQDADSMLAQYFAENAAAREEWDQYAKLRGHDPRVTRMGRFLRRFSLDELPQIINVLKGEMSLVGPRPYLPRERQVMGRFLQDIVRTTPGITGLWQVSGRNETSFQERLLLDVYYIRNWSIWLDISLIVRTLKAVVVRRGAY